MIRDVFSAIQSGEEERLVTDDEKHQFYMRAVGDANDQFLGYYERYEPSSRMTTSQEHE